MFLQYFNITGIGGKYKGCTASNIRFLGKKSMRSPIDSWKQSFWDENLMKSEHVTDAPQHKSHLIYDH